MICPSRCSPRERSVEKRSVDRDIGRRAVAQSEDRRKRRKAKGQPPNTGNKKGKIYIYIAYGIVIAKVVLLSLIFPLRERLSREGAIRFAHERYRRGVGEKKKRKTGKKSKRKRKRGLTFVVDGIHSASLEKSSPQA